MTTEKIICNDVIEHLPFVKYFKAAECREKLFGNLLLKILALILACVVNLGCLVRTGRWKLVALASYFNIYLKLRDIFKNFSLRKSKKGVGCKLRIWPLPNSKLDTTMFRLSEHNRAHYNYLNTKHNCVVFLNLMDLDHSNI